MAELIHVTASEPDLIDEAVRLSEYRAQGYLTPERKEQITLQMDRIFYELQVRQEIALESAS